ncbi:MAG: hypothetical protein Q9169_006559, partial [Polycauliona sp. 2 TL-2023]
DAVNRRAPTSSQMQSGRVYVGRLPNHNGPVFVRKRRNTFANPFGVPSITTVHAAQHYLPNYQPTTTAVYQPPPPTYAMPAPATQMVQVSQPAEASTTTVTTTVEQPQPLHISSKHSCGSCGKYRSARYHYRHPLAPGETPRPKLCRKCVKQHTSSEEYDDMKRMRRRRPQREGRKPYRYRSYSSDEWSSSSSHEERRRHHRYRSSDDKQRRRRSDQSSLGHSTKVYIIRQAEERRPQPSSSSEHVRFARHARTDNGQPRPILRTRHRYGPYDGHYSHEEFHEDLEIGDGDYFRPRGRSRSRSFGRRSHDGSFDDEYVRLSTITSRSRPLSLFDRLTGSRSGRSSSYEDERVRVTVRSRGPSPLHYERHEEEYEERSEESHRSPWHQGGRSTRSLRGYSPRPSSRRRSSIHGGLSPRPRVRFARSTSSHRAEHKESHGRSHRGRHYRPRSDFSFSDEEEFPSAESRLRRHGFRYVRGPSPSPIRYESRRHSITHESHHDDEGFGGLFNRSYLTPPIQSHSYMRRRSHSREHSDPFHGGESYESRRRVRVIDV